MECSISEADKVVSEGLLAERQMGHLTEFQLSAVFSDRQHSLLVVHGHV
jgi:hypothetical protein